MSEPIISDQDIWAVAEFVYPNSIHIVSLRGGEWFLNNVYTMPPFWESLDAWEKHVVPKFKDWLHMQDQWVREMQRMIGVVEDVPFEFAHASAAVRTMALAQVLREMGAS